MDLHRGSANLTKSAIFILEYSWLRINISELTTLLALISLSILNMILLDYFVFYSLNFADKNFAFVYFLGGSMVLRQ